MPPDLARSYPLASKHASPAAPTESDPETQLEIPIQAQVAGSDGECGQLMVVLINPLTEQLTHLVVRGWRAPHTELLVPTALVTGVCGNVIQVRCTQAEFAALEPFIQTEYVRTTLPDPAGMHSRVYPTGDYFYWPFVNADKTVGETIEHREIPLGEIAVRRGARVEATDGPVGHVDEFVLKAGSSHITHLVLRDGQPWAPTDILIPIDALDGMRHDRLYLKLDKQGVAALPAFPVKRHWA